MVLLWETWIYLGMSRHNGEAARNNLERYLVEQRVGARVTEDLRKGAGGDCPIGELPFILAGITARLKVGASWQGTCRGRPDHGAR